MGKGELVHLEQIVGNKPQWNVYVSGSTGSVFWSGVGFVVMVFLSSHAII